MRKSFSTLFSRFGTIFKRREVNDETKYHELLKSIEGNEGKDFDGPLREIHREISESITESYKNENIYRLFEKVSSRNLCNFAVEHFVGSVTSPRNQFVCNLFLHYAHQNAKDAEAKQHVLYYQFYLEKLQAIQTGDKEQFSKANENLLQLSKEGHPLSIHIVAKEIYKVALNILSGKQKKNKKEMILECFNMFTEAASKNSYQSFYYLGEMAENGDIPGGVDLKYAYECYSIAASHDSPEAFFKLAKFYKEGMIEKKNPELQLFYTKRAAELGLIEAQHNLGCMYMEGEIVPYDGLKALAWFTHAGAHGFAHSKYNAAKIYMEGSKDNQVKRNDWAALSLLTDIEEKYKLDVSQDIKLVAENILKEKK